jgi:hypothetical protein
VLSGPGGSANLRLFVVFPGSSLTLEDLALRSGQARGGSGGTGNDEARRHGQAGARHLPQVRGLAAGRAAVPLAQALGPANGPQAARTLREGRPTTKGPSRRRGPAAGVGEDVRLGALARRVRPRRRAPRTARSRNHPCPRSTPHALLWPTPHACGVSLRGLEAPQVCVADPARVRGFPPPRLRGQGPSPAHSIPLREGRPARLPPPDRRGDRHVGARTPLTRAPGPSRHRKNLSLS